MPPCPAVPVCVGAGGGMVRWGDPSESLRKKTLFFE